MYDTEVTIHTFPGVRVPYLEELQLWRAATQMLLAGTED